MRLLMATGAVLLLAAAAATAALIGDDRGCERPSYGPYGGGASPDACWRPYADSSPFNTPLPAEPRLHARSDAIVEALNRGGPPAPLRANLHGTEQDFDKAVFYARADDPVVTVRCAMPWGRCDLEGRRIRLPAGARAAAGGDGHLTVVDQETGWEYDLWRAGQVEDGRLVTAWGGRTRIDGDGLGSDAVAARFGSLAGIVRAEELAAGRVDHALFITVPCGGSDGHVPPATKGAHPCDDDSQQPVAGMRLQLDMPAEEIDALDAPGWKKALLHAMRRYGVIMGDTGGPPGWALQLQSDTSYTSLGDAPRLLEFAKEQGWQPVADDAAGRTLYLGDLASGVDWRRLRVVHPCVSSGRC